jgi:RNA polymerase sigma-70 factor, ECF subfamily
MDGVLGVRPLSSDERGLADRVLAGDEEAFATLFHRYRNDVYRAARAVTGSHEDSLDVVQETFVKVHRRLSTWSGEAALRTWIVRIGVRTAIDATRKTRRHRVDPAVEPSHDPRPTLERAALVARLRELAARLRGTQAVVLSLRVFDDRPTREIAELLDITEANVRVQLSKALRRLKEML